MKVQERERMSQPARLVASSLDNAQHNERTAARQVPPSEGGIKLWAYSWHTAFYKNKTALYRVFQKELYNFESL